MQVNIMKYLTPDAAGRLDFAQIAIPAPETGQVLVKIHAIGVNRADLLQAAGRYPPPAGDSPILGLEMAGEVVTLGSGVGKEWLGKKVTGLCSGGAYAEYVAIDVSHLLPLPESLSYRQGAGVCETYLTAYDALFRYGRLSQGQTALIHAGASGVGSAAIKLAKHCGANVVVTAGSDEKCAFATQIGADLALNYRRHDWAKAMKDAGFEANVIVDPVAGDYLDGDLKVAAMDCQIVVLAILGGRYAERFDVARLLQKRVSLHGSTLRNRSVAYKSALVAAFCDDFYQALSEGELQPEIDRVFDWQNANEAHARLADNRNLGKVVLTLP